MNHTIKHLGIISIKKITKSKKIQKQKIKKLQNYKIKKLQNQKNTKKQKIKLQFF
tara:strand:- start:1522 stop:1686 length:165 start_codon:yes stop_codon:yes gene_type:complete